ncbi:hypothetical protein DPMN_083589 [Dreissena polymorpha]|uniref:Uncharacterized protein n=1 Tax=Dreissena polymorpha TaxID=45954 RepID=A0A9D4BB89_DREPO|nr:hypothetical protein DPMN_083589 [Dreissena polymorpha]
MFIGDSLPVLSSCCDTVKSSNCKSYISHPLPALPPPPPSTSNISPDLYGLTCVLNTSPVKLLSYSEEL